MSKIYEKNKTLKLILDRVTFIFHVYCCEGWWGGLHCIINGYMVFIKHKGKTPVTFYLYCHVFSSSYHFFAHAYLAFEQMLYEYILCLISNRF